MPRVLVVDDHSEKREDLARTLRLAGFDTRVADSAGAIDEASAAGVDLAIVDLMLHGTNGFELARRMRTDAPSVRVVLTSDYHFSATQLARIDCGAVGFVPRPFELEELTSFLWSKLTPTSVRTLESAIDRS
jgi:two-component system OmpR family response regulator